MVDDAWAYDALGLASDATWAEVNHAYKRLIRAHHPDLAGGDSKRAAQITQAYRELARARHQELELVESRPEPVIGRHRRMWAVPGVIFLAGVLAVAKISPPTRSTSPTSIVRDPVVKPGDLMAGPLAVSAIESSVNEARRLASTRDETALASASRLCHHELRANPSIARLDRCAAFDDAVIQIRNRDPLRDQGPFSEIAVTSRQLS